MKGHYQCLQPSLLQIYKNPSNGVHNFNSISFEHIYYTFNLEVDTLAKNIFKLHNGEFKIEHNFANFVVHVVRFLFQMLYK